MSGKKVCQYTFCLYNKVSTGILTYMEYVIYALFGLNLLVFAMAAIALARVGKFVRATEDLDWQSVANITGDLGAVKKTIQTLNNRLNGMNSSKVDQEALLVQLSQYQQPQVEQRGG